MKHDPSDKVRRKLLDIGICPMCKKEAPIDDVALIDDKSKAPKRIPCRNCWSNGSHEFLARKYRISALNGADQIAGNLLYGRLDDE